MRRNTRIWAVAGLLAAFVAQAYSQVLRITQFDVSNAQGGLNIQADYSGIDPQCCDPANVRWLQRILLLDGNGNRLDTVNGYPIGDFIDPQPTQPPGGWDGDPWYDVTYNSAADRATDTNRQNGAGAFFNDSPGGWRPFGPVSFLAFTAVVCINSTTKEAAFLGGFTWGFNIPAQNGNVSGILPGILGNTQATATMFNDSIALGAFANSGWRVVVGDPNCQLTVQSVPEPMTMALSLAAGGLAVRRLRARRRTLV